MGKAFSCDVCGKLVKGTPEGLEYLIKVTGNERIGLCLLMYGHRDQGLDDEEVWDPSVCIQCQITALKEVLNSFKE